MKWEQVADIALESPAELIGMRSRHFNFPPFVADPAAEKAAGPDPSPWTRPSDPLRVSAAAEIELQRCHKLAENSMKLAHLSKTARAVLASGREAAASWP